MSNDSSESEFYTDTEGKHRLVVIRGGEAGRVFPLHEGNNLIGRWDPDSGSFPEVDLESEDIDAKISRKHAVVEWQGAKVTVEDLGSLNGTFLNRDKRLQEGERCEIKAGDEIVIGKVILRFETD